MGIFEALAQALAAGLSIWDTKESRRYLVRVLEIKKEWYEEYNKELSDDAILDNLERELCLIATTFYSEVGKQNAQTK